jgi:4-hydroxy-3-polyprenylbenzoate decarboxylase
MPAFKNYQEAANDIQVVSSALFASQLDLNGFPLILICDDDQFVAQSFGNLIWSTFTRANPSHDIYGVDSFIEYKHWGCKGPLIIDIRMKPHNAPYLELDPKVEKAVDKLGAKGGSLHGII